MEELKDITIKCKSMDIPQLVKDKRRFYGTYAVMALMNAQTVLDHILKVAALPIIPAKDKYGKVFEPNAEDLWLHPVMRYMNYVSYNKDEYPEKTLVVMERLQKYFPFLKIFVENQREYFNKKNNVRRLENNSNDLYGVLNAMLRVIKKYRDTTTHYMTNDECWNDGSDFLRKYEQPLAIMTDSYYEVALRNMKERYSYTTDDLRFIQDYRYKRARGSDGRPAMRKNLDFFLSMTAYNGDANKKLHLSAVGVALLICLFLDKQYINQFVTNLALTSKYLPSSKEAQVIRRSLGMHNIVQPKDRIQSEKSSMSVAMDMLGEIKRCPKELFDTLAEARQSQFRLISSDHSEVLLMRSKDRFAQLALQYIDYGRKFDQIRFHVNMGRLRYLFNTEKTCVDGQTRVRVIEHQLNGFGRIDEMEAHRKGDDGTFGNTGIKIRDFENMIRDDADPNHYPYIVDTYTRYMLDGNHVEMLIGKDMDMPQAEEYYGKWYVSKTVPTCRMSTLELPAMMFHMHLLGAKRTEARIIDVYNRYMKLFEALEHGEVTQDNIDSFGIDRSDMPQKVNNVVGNTSKIKSCKEYTERRLREMYEDTCKRIERLKQDKRLIGTAANKMGKRGFAQIRPGRLAEYLMCSIVAWQPTLCSGNDYGSDRLTGLNYRVMQSAIAIYDSHGSDEEKRQLRTIFENAGLIGGDRERNHPFLGKVLGYRLPEDVVELYDRYIHEQKRYLVSLLDSIRNGECPHVPFVNVGQNKWKKPSQKYIGQVYTEDKAVDLPHQMFDKEIKEHLSKMPQMQDIDFDHANVTYLIAEYMRRVRDDSFQDFYSWKRNYRYIDMLKGDIDKTGRTPKMAVNWTTTDEREALWRDREKQIKRYSSWADSQLAASPQGRGLNAQERDTIIARRIVNSRNEYQKNEKVIRRYKVQDALLFLMTCDTLTQFADFNGHQFKLRDIMPDAAKGILSEAMPIDFKFTKNGTTYIIHADEMKLKNYGDFFVLANDKRLEKLLKLVGRQRVEKSELDAELKRYDVCRPEVVRMVFDLEKMAFDLFPQLAERVKAGGESGKIGFKDILEVLLKEGKIKERQKEVLRLIRNSFDHNNYPSSGVVEVVTLPDIANNMKELFGQYAHVV